MNKTPKNIIKQALLTILRPLVRLLLKHEMSHSEFSEIAKEVFVQVAFEDLTLPGRKPTVSRAAVLTGLSRKEVSRLIGNPASSPLTPKITPNRAARVITGWLNDYADSDGKNLAKSLNKQELSALIKRYSGDITSGAITDELLRLGIIKTDKTGNYCLIKNGYIIANNNSAEGFNVLSQAVANLLATGEYNLSLHEKGEPSESRFQKQLTLRSIPQQLRNEFAQHFNHKAMALLLELNQWHVEQLERHQQLKPSYTTATKDAKTLGIGIYYFESHQEKKGNEE